MKLITCSEIKLVVLLLNRNINVTLIEIFTSKLFILIINKFI